MLKKKDIVSFTMCIFALISLIIPFFIITRENRIARRVWVSAKASLGINYWVLLAMMAILFILVLIKSCNSTLNFITGLWASVIFAFTIYFVALSANVLDIKTDNFRITFGLGTYLIFISMYGVEIKCNEYLKAKWKKYLVYFTGFIILTVLGLLGCLDELSVMKEFYSRYSQWAQELQNHLMMSLKVVVMSILLGLPLGYISYRYKSVGSVLTSVLNVIESIPSLAMICLLMVPLSIISNKYPFMNKLGISGFGECPIFFALLFYGLFQIIHSMYGALKMVNGDYIETARAMGMTDKTIFLKVQVPLVLPVIISGIRITIIQTIEGVTIGALAGYGGLGMFIYQGGDTLLLGTIPVMIMIFIFDYGFKKIVTISEIVNRKRRMVRL